MYNDKRIEYIDLLRIIACFLVIVNHTNSTIFQNSTPYVPQWWYSISFFLLSRIAVPIFIMITGATVLNKQEDYKKSFKRVLRAVLVLILFSLIYYCRKTLRNDNFSLKDFFLQIYNKPITNAYWYMYLYIGILIMIPFIRKMVKDMKKKDFFVFFIISLFINSTWPIFTHYQPALAFNSNFDMPLFESYICYLLLGYYLFNYSNKSRGKFILALLGFGMGLAVSIILTYFEYMKNCEKYTFFSNRTLLFIAIPSICCFYMCSFINVRGGLGRIINIIGECTFGIYLLSDYFIGMFKPVYTHISKLIPILLAMFIFQGIIFGAGLLVSFILKHIPFIKNIV